MTCVPKYCVYSEVGLMMLQWPFESAMSVLSQLNTLTLSLTEHLAVSTAMLLLFTSADP